MKLANPLMSSKTEREVSVNCWPVAPPNSIFSGEKQQRFVLRLPAEARDRAVVSIPVQPSANAESSTAARRQILEKSAWFRLQPDGEWERPMMVKML
jgi:hypothetical protein